MRIKQKIKLLIDCVMTALLATLMAYSLVGEVLHEWIGVAMLLCLIAHHILNIHKSSVRNATAMVNLVLNAILFALLLTQMISGMILSRTVFRFLPLDSGYSFARDIHLPLAYWSYIIMSLHLGLHWNTVFVVLKKLCKRKLSANRTMLLRGVAGIVSAYGVYAFFARELPAYLFLKYHFVLYDYDEPLFFFFTDFLAIMILFSMMGYLIMKLVIRKKGSKNSY